MEHEQIIGFEMSYLFPPLFLGANCLNGVYSMWEGWMNCLEGALHGPEKQSIPSV